MNRNKKIETRYALPFEWPVSIASQLLCDRYAVNMLFTFSQVNLDKGLLYREVSLTSSHLERLFHLPYCIQALSILWMIQEGSGQLNRTRYTACSLTSLCGKSKLFRGLMLYTVDNSRCSWIFCWECDKIHSKIWDPARNQTLGRLQLYPINRYITGKTCMLIQVFSVFV